MELGEWRLCFIEQDMAIDDDFICGEIAFVNTMVRRISQENTRSSARLVFVDFYGRMKRVIETPKNQS